MSRIMQKPIFCIVKPMQKQWFRSAVRKIAQLITAYVFATYNVVIPVFGASSQFVTVQQNS